MHACIAYVGPIDVRLQRKSYQSPGNGFSHGIGLSRKAGLDAPLNVVQQKFCVEGLGSEAKDLLLCVWVEGKYLH